MLGVGSCGVGFGNGQYLLGISSGFYDVVDVNNVLLFVVNNGIEVVCGVNLSFVLVGYIDIGVFDFNFGVYDIQLMGVLVVLVVFEFIIVMLMLGGLVVCGVVVFCCQCVLIKILV